MFVVFKVLIALVLFALFALKVYARCSGDQSVAPSDARTPTRER